MEWLVFVLFNHAQCQLTIFPKVFVPYNFDIKFIEAGSVAPNDELFAFDNDNLGSTDQASFYIKIVRFELSCSAIVGIYAKNFNLVSKFFVEFVGGLDTQK